MDITGYKLIIFDGDGTLNEYKTTNLLPGVKAWFDQAPADLYIAIASNQGGVGMREWMELDHFGNPSEFPSEADARASMATIVRRCGRDMLVFICFAYVTKKGKPAKVRARHHDDPMWSLNWRKPNPGMLLEAMRGHRVTPEQTLMVGDWPEDQEAAEAAGCAFAWADEFFDRDSSEANQFNRPPAEKKENGLWDVADGE